MREKFNSNDIKLIVGLGNPGSTYKGTYHNAGYHVIDRLALLNDAKFRSLKSLTFSMASNTNPRLIKPDTYMNVSGKTVCAALKKYRIHPTSLLVIHDDTDLELGKYKLGFASRSAGHHGIDSIIANLKTNKFWRARVGVRPIGLEQKNKRIRAGEFVLKRMSQDELNILDDVANRIANLINPFMEKS